ncbi:1-acyl-sn-glycerol-3-phosphate acyltransferase [Candidatus Woesearchaeota archaeon]|nr:1-acyl-sn-glycerol-3-phosphate acyltransferase [Candidatus Woesearchaeota archaeon]
MDHLPMNDGEVKQLSQDLMMDDSLVDKLSGYSGFDVGKDLSGVDNVCDFQRLSRRFLEIVLRKTSDGFTSSGIQDIDMSRGHLFVSNHRDIVLDPALLSLELGRHKHETAFNIFGDNLAGGLAGHLLRANRGYMLVRSGSGREKAGSFRDLSYFILDSIGLDHHVWIAQRDGRAKDGIDRTNPSLIKHLYSAHRAIPFDAFVSRLSIVPLAVSYEFDPCEMSKARELYLRDKHGSYEKSATEDLKSILLGLTDYKGRIHLSFGTPLKGMFETPRAVADEIDMQIRSGYLLFPSNHDAVRLKEDPQADVPLKRRISEYPAELQPFILDMYANPVYSKRRADAAR